MQKVARHNLRAHSQSKCVQIQSIFIKCESQNFTMCPNNPGKIYGRVKLKNVARAFFTKCWSQECLFVRHINRENALTTFLSILQADNLQNGSELHSKQLRFWTHKWWKFFMKFLFKPWRQRTLERCLNFAANSFFLDTQIVELYPELFL